MGALSSKALKRYIWLSMPGNVPSVVYLYRITHYKNLPFILQHGLHCPAAELKDPNYINIGKKDIIEKREQKRIVIAPYGHIHDYVSFYFGPRSPMLYSIFKGASDTDCKQQDIVYIVSTLPVVAQAGLSFVFTTGQAIMALSTQHNQLEDLSRIDWDVIKSKFWHDKPPEYPDRRRQRMAEFLVYQHVPVNCILGLGVFNKKKEEVVIDMVRSAALPIPVKQKPEWYY